MPRTSWPYAATFSETRSPQCVSCSPTLVALAGVDLLCCSGHRDRLDLGGAEFVFGDLADRVELRGWQHMGGGFGVAERDEHRAGGDGAVAARLQLDGAAPGGDADLFAGGDAEPAQFGGGEAGDRLGLDLGQAARSPRPRAGM